LQRAIGATGRADRRQLLPAHWRLRPASLIRGNQPRDRQYLGQTQFDWARGSHREHVGVGRYRHAARPALCGRGTDRRRPQLGLSGARQRVLAWSFGRAEAATFLRNSPYRRSSSSCSMVADGAFRGRVFWLNTLRNGEANINALLDISKLEAGVIKWEGRSRTRGRQGHAPR